MSSKNNTQPKGSKKTTDTKVAETATTVLVTAPVVAATLVAAPEVSQGGGKKSAASKVQKKEEVKVVEQAAGAAVEKKVKAEKKAVEQKAGDVAVPTEPVVEQTAGAKKSAPKAKAAAAPKAEKNAVAAPKAKAAAPKAKAVAAPKAEKKTKAAKGEHTASEVVSKKKSKKVAAATSSETVATEGPTETEVLDASGKQVRSFKVMLPGTENYEGRFTGLTPYQAANKALSKYYRENKQPKKEIVFSIRESTRGSKRSTYTYNGQREKLNVPVEYSIKDGRTIVKNFKNRLTKIKKAELETTTVDA
jgi:hypothetical protein